ncbi:MAG: sigma-70 family RNA polymerase sigma factor, partial [Oscillospiraceae bacterium]|nr:sigma-70 family RNA polymerase sigma factor [Oscillospiraceae bacterium]
MTREQENAVVRAVLNGDVNAFEMLVREYEKNVYNLALRMVGNSEDAADMSQEAFIKAYNSLDSFRGDSKFSVWLYRIVSNVCLDFIRSRKRKQTVSLSMEDDNGDDVELDIADDTQSPERLMD